MNRLPSLFFLLAVLTHAACANDIRGAGSSAAAPLYNKWAEAYANTTDAALDYQANGSSAGIKKIKGSAVDFGASDVALSQAELKKENLIQFPSAISGVAPVLNLPGIKAGELRLSGALLAAIFSRRITQWNDAAIAALNPQLRLPNKQIEVIVRQDGSGTTYNFTDYLCKVSKEWQAGYGKNFTIAWHPKLTQVKGSANVSAAVKKTPYALAYIDYNYVVQDKLDFTQLQNREGKFLAPSAEAFSAALAASSWKSRASFEEMLTDKAGPKAWPITMGTFILMQKNARDNERSSATLKFFTWAFMSGDRYVNSVDFVRLPDHLQARVFREMTTVSDRGGKPLKWSAP